MRCLKIHIIPRIAYYPTASNVVDLPFTVYVPRNSTVGELQIRIALSLQAKSDKGKGESLLDLCKWARILKVDYSNESAEDINNQVYGTQGDESQLPIEVVAEVLEKHMTIDQLNLADGEILVYEIKLNFEDDAELPFCLLPVVEETQVSK